MKPWFVGNLVLNSVHSRKNICAHTKRYQCYPFHLRYTHCHRYTDGNVDMHVKWIGISWIVNFVCENEYFSVSVVYCAFNMRLKLVFFLPLFHHSSTWHRLAFNSRRGTGLFFSMEALDAFLAKHELSHVIRAHEYLGELRCFFFKLGFLP